MRQVNNISLLKSLYYIVYNKQNIVSCRHPSFLKDMGDSFMAFIPLIEVENVAI